MKQHYSRKITCACVVVMLFFLHGTSIGQVANYSVTSEYQGSSPQPVILPTDPSLLLLPVENIQVREHVEEYVLPFPFIFNGKEETSLYVSMEGFIAFGVAPTGTEHTPISSSVNYRGVISPFATNLWKSSLPTNISVRDIPADVVAGTPRMLEVAWNLRLETTIISTPFSIKLVEGTNEIIMSYNLLTYTSNFTNALQIGLRGPNSTDFSNLTYDGVAAWPNSTMASGTSNSATVAFSRNGTSVTAFPRSINQSHHVYKWMPSASACFAPVEIEMLSHTNNSIQIQWNAVHPSPSSGYEYYVSTSATPPSSSTTPTGVTAAGVNTATIGGLTAATSYYVWVRSRCGSARSAWSVITAVFSTSCNPEVVPYYIGFDQASLGYTVPAIPVCSAVSSQGGNRWVTTSQNEEGFEDEHLKFSFHPTVPANTWFFTKGIQLDATKQYKISYKYGGSSEYNFIFNIMDVKYGMGQSSSLMTNLLETHADIKDSPMHNTIVFSPDVSGVYNFGFNVRSAANMGYVFLDDILIEESFCFAPTNISSVNIFSNSATVYWDNASPVPSDGYEYYISTTPLSSPSSSQVPTDLVSPGSFVTNLTGLAANTTYYIWVRSRCGGAERSPWSAVHSFTTNAGVVPSSPYCIPNPSSVDGQGIVRVQLGDINNSTGAEPGNYGDYSHLSTTVYAGETSSVMITYNTSFFDYNTRVWIDWNRDGDFLDTGELVATGLSASTSPNTLTLNFVVPGTATGSYRMRIGGADMDTNLSPCYTGSWASFEDYTINVLPSPPALQLSSSSVTMCRGDVSGLVQITPATVGNYQSYSWSPSIGVVGDAATGFYFNPETTTNYVLTGNQNIAPFGMRQVNFLVVVNNRPTNITILPEEPSICGDEAVQLVQQGGAVGGATIIENNFNNTTLDEGWSLNNTGQPIVGWNLHNSPYAVPGLYFETIRSRDNSRFIFTNSDLGGLGSSTRTELISPVFDLSAYDVASLSFEHYYRGFPNGYGAVQISINGGTTWQDLERWTTVSRGTANLFAIEEYDLTPYLGNSQVRIKFLYTSNWGWGWALDNILVSGSGATGSVWTPYAGLFMDENLLIPYTGQITTEVYAKPAVSTEYTVRTTSLNGCFTEVSVNVEVEEFEAGTITAATMTCASIEPLELEGNIGAVVRWEYSIDGTFGPGTEIISNTTTTLSVVEMNAFDNDGHFRAIVSSGSCEGASNAVMVSLNSTTFNGTSWSNFTPDPSTKALYNVSGNYTITSNINACSLEIVSGNITVAPGVTVRVINDLKVTNGSLTFENGSSLIQVNNVANSGNITYKRNTTPMYKDDYTYWSSPVSNFTLAAFSPFTSLNRMFFFDAASVNNWVSINAVGGAAHTMEAARGYIVQAPSGGPVVFPRRGEGSPVSFEGVFVGVPHNGDYSAPIDGALPNRGNFIGNPYPSAIDVHRFLLEPGNESVLGTIYLWTHNSGMNSNYDYTVSDFATYNFTGSVGVSNPASTVGVNTSSPTRYIAAGQGFFIDGVDDVLGANVTFKNSMRVAGNNTNNFYRFDPMSEGYNEEEEEIGIEKHRLWLELNNGSQGAKQMLVGYIEGATDGFDRLFDGRTITVGGMNIYSLLEQNRLTIQGKSLPFDETDVVPIGVEIIEEGMYGISLAQVDPSLSNQTVYIEDLYLNTVHLLNGSEYQFFSDEGQFDDRFQIKFQSQELSLDEYQSNHVYCFVDGRNLVVRSAQEELSEVVVYDVLGRMVSYQDHLNAREVTIESLGQASQVYLVKAKTIENEWYTIKVLVN